MGRGMELVFKKKYVIMNYEIVIRLKESNNN